MTKVDLTKVQVASFDAGQGVEASGFYTLEGTGTDESEVKVYGDFEWNDDGEGNLTPATRPRVVDRILVKHDSHATPKQRVYPSPDGEGFVYDDPNADEEGGDE